MERFDSYLRLQSYNVIELGFEPQLLDWRDHARNHGMFCLFLSYSTFPMTGTASPFSQAIYSP